MTMMRPVLRLRTLRQRVPLRDFGTDGEIRTPYTIIADAAINSASRPLRPRARAMSRVRAQRLGSVRGLTDPPTDLDDSAMMRFIANTVMSLIVAALMPATRLLLPEFMFKKVLAQRAANA